MIWLNGAPLFMFHSGTAGLSLDAEAEAEVLADGDAFIDKDGGLSRAVGCGVIDLGP